jgi:hypothetical protein
MSVRLTMAHSYKKMRESGDNQIKKKKMPIITTTITSAAACGKVATETTTEATPEGPVDPKVRPQIFACAIVTAAHKP